MTKKTVEESAVEESAVEESTVEESAADTIPLSGLLFHVENESTHLKDTTNFENDADAPDTIDSGLESPLFDDTPLELPPGFYADTSPGSIESPDTLQS